MAFIFNSIVKRFDEKFREAYICPQIKKEKMIPTAERFIRDNMSESDSLYVENINEDDNQFTVFGRGFTTEVNLLTKSCFCRKYDLV